MNVLDISQASSRLLAPYFSLTETQLSRDCGLFVAESPKVIATALSAGYRPISLLCEERHIGGDASTIIAACPDDMPVLTGSREELRSLTGYTLTRGVLCAMQRRPLPTISDIAAGARRIAVIDGVCDTTNIGAIFRSAAALGMDAVVVTPGTCDPLNRRSVRVSMGSVFLIPWTWGNPTELQALGFKTAAMALTDSSIPISDPQLRSIDRLALVLGTEGDGLAQQVIDSCDLTVRIPMAHGVDSLNVSNAAAVAFYLFSLWQE